MGMNKYRVSFLVFLFIAAIALTFVIGFPRVFPHLHLWTPVRASEKNCKDFKSQSDAQAYFVSHGGPGKDIYLLDADHNGVACQSFKY